jgi:cell pole-organizing protein PopZ
MEDILASIRRILNEDDSGPSKDAAATVEAPKGEPGHAVPDEGVLVLDESMLIHRVERDAPPPAAVLEEPEHMPEPIAAMTEPEPAPEPEAEPVILSAAHTSSGTVSADSLLAPETAAAAAVSVSSLLKSLSNERSTQVHRDGPTIEDLVREEIRPLLKDWLDQHLPPLVERLVRTEIERVAGRAAG